MSKSRTRTILLLGLMALVLIGCRPLEDNVIQPDPIQSVEGQDLPTLEQNVETSTNETADLSSNYSEGFTEDGYPFKGNPSAPVTIEEFTSYQCPFCARYFRESYPQLMLDYVESGQVLYIFRDFPLPSQPQSPVAAEAARCAGQVGGGSAYWAMHDQIFVGQREWSGKGNAAEILKSYAAELGLDAKNFGQCLDSGANKASVQADSREGSSRGVNGTPTFFINGRALVGAQPYSAFAQAVDAALSGEAALPPTPAAPAAAPTPATIAPTDDARVLGDLDAPVTIVEFSDYQCPFCARHFQQTWPQLKTDYIDTGRIKYVFKDFPITSIHPEAPKAHEAARCAGDQDAYWALHDRLFLGQEEWAGNQDHVTVFKGYAAELGLDQGAFDACLDGGRNAANVSADVREGRSLGVTGTPTFFVDGYPLVGAQSIEVFQQAIDLAEKGTLGDAFRLSQ